VAADLTGEAPPATTFGLVVEGLRRRRERGVGPFTLMSCDNIPGNGEVARRALTSYARALDPDLAAWIEAEVAFPNGMVDRITPVTTAEDVAQISELFGVADAWPVVAEPFFQWVLEDTFVAGLSMGGYGALKLGLTHPDRYAAVASLSGVAKIQGLVTDLPRPEIVDRVFGGEISPSDDVLALLDAADPATLPRLYVGCGTEEEVLLPQNRRLVEAATTVGLDVTVDFRPGGHEWKLWDAQIQDVIEWLPVRTT
jgi:pimeloyl-ACP methyl ester carboxylesterase